METRATTRLSRRQFARVCGIGAAGTGIALAQRTVIPAKSLVVGKVRVVDVKVILLLQPSAADIALTGGVCLMGPNAGLGFRAEVELDGPKSGSGYFGMLTLLQNVDYAHKRWSTQKVGGSYQQCATSNSQWQVDGTYPYKLPLTCGQGPNIVNFADEPSVKLEEAGNDFEKVTAQTLDQFRTFVIWEITNSNLPPRPGTRATPHVLARIDWNWNGTALNSAPTPACSVGGDAWAILPTDPHIAQVRQPLVWPLALSAPAGSAGKTVQPFFPFHTFPRGTPGVQTAPMATPNVWPPC